MYVRTQDIQIFDVVAIDTDTVFTKESVLDPLPLRIQQIQQLVCVHLFGGCEEGDLVLLRYLFQEFFDVRPGTDKYL